VAILPWMAMIGAASQQVVDAVIERARNIVETLSGLDDDELRGSSGSRNGVDCRLRATSDLEQGRSLE